MTETVRHAGELGAIDDEASEVEGLHTGEMDDDELDRLLVDLEDEDEKKCEECADQEDVEIKPPKFMRRPGQPSKAEKEAHDALHVNFRSWCRYCVMGKGMHRHHRTKKMRQKNKKSGDKKADEDNGKVDSSDAEVDEEGKSLIPLISMDYCFLGTHRTPANKVPILVIRDEMSKSIMAYHAGRKGIVDWVIDSVIVDLAEWGYGGSRIAIKTDQEESIIALRNEIIARRKSETVPKLSVKRDPQSHGEIEVAVKNWAGQFRTWKCHIEGETGQFLPINCNAVSWLGKWAANSINMYRVQAHGCTAHEAVGGRHCKTPICPFGEHIQWKKQRDGSPARKAESDWFDGIFLGVRPISGECIVGSASGVVYCRTVRRVIDSDRWSMQAIKDVSESVCQVERSQHGGTQPSSSAPVLVGWKDIGPEIPAGKDTNDSSPVPDATISSPVGNSKSDDAPVENFDGNIHVGDGLSEDAFELFGPDDMEDFALESAPGTPHHDSRERTSDGVRVATDNEGRVIFAEMDTGQNDIRGRPTRRRRVESDDEEPNEPSDSAPSKRGRPSNSEGKDDDELLNTVTEVIENRKILSAIIRGVDITEIYSPERVVKACLKQNLVPGSSMDLTSGWDFSKKEHREAAVRQISKEKPTLLIGSPPCTFFSILQNLNLEIRNDAWKEKFHVNLEAAKEHVRFCIRLYRLQRNAGRYFLHEHPRTATSWKMEEVQELLHMPDILRAESDQCRFGLTTVVKGEELLAKKPTSFLTNSWAIERELSKKCQGDHVHGHLIEGRARAAQVYPPQLCDAICRGLRIQINHDESGKTVSKAMTIGELSSIVGSARGYPQHWIDKYHEIDGTPKGQEETDGVKILKEQLFKLGCRGGVMWARDDLTGSELNAKLVVEARDLEMQYFRSMRVYDKVPRAEAYGKPTVRTMWIDVNKGDAANPQIRSRLVGKEFRVDEDPGLYAATPPLEALRVILSRAANNRNMKVMTNDVSRAYFNAPATRELYIELPKEDQVEGEGDLVGKMRLCLYGTRDAALNWQNVVAEHLQSIGFQRGVAFPCIYYHPKRQITTLVHGDDYASSGYDAELKWLDRELRRRFEIKTCVVSSSKEDLAETKILNRIIRVTPHGWELEADPRHAELIIEDMGLQNAKSVVTPGEDVSHDETGGDDEELDEYYTQRFRSLTARANYLSADRPDLQFSVKELCRDMSRPKQSSWNRLKRVAKFLIGKPRMVWKYCWEDCSSELDGYSDSNWAGCRVSRKSTSGGAVMIGSHVIRTWSKTQSTLALSSAEAELFGGVKTACETLGVASLLSDLGQEVKLRMHMDASAALGIAQRKGVGKVRHLSTGTLWLQEQELKDILKIQKIPGSDNIADIFTKNLGQAILQKHLDFMNLEYKGGRASAAAQLHTLRIAQRELKQLKWDILKAQQEAESPIIGDSWIDNGNGRVRIREHSDGRRQLFTPLNVRHGPVSKLDVGSIRTTIGKFDRGGLFTKHDHWDNVKYQNQQLQTGWKGITVFSDKPLSDITIDLLKGRVNTL